MSAFPIPCNMAHARQIRHSVSHRNHSDPGQDAKLLANHSDRTHHRPIQRHRSSSPKKKTHYLNDYGKDISSDMMKLHHEIVSRHAQYIHGIYMTEYTNLRLGQPSALLLRSISIDGVPSYLFSIGKQNENSNYTDENCVRIMNRKYSAGATFSKNSTNSEESALCPTFGVRLARSMPLATAIAFNQRDFK